MDAATLLRSRRATALALTLFGLVLVASWVFYELTKPVWDSTDAFHPEAIHQAVIAGTAPYPIQFRPLTPWLAEAMFRGGVPLRLGYLLIHVVCWYLAALVLYRFLRRWLPAELSFAGAVCFIALLPFSVIGSHHQPTDPLNVLLFFLAYEALAARRDGWLFVILLVGMFNRETIALVALLAAFVRLDEWRTLEYWRLVIGLAAIAAALYLGLHVGYGPRESYTDLITPAANIPENLTRVGSLRALVLYGALWWYALLGLREQPQFLRRSVILIPAFLGVHFLIGLVGETRYFLPLAPTVLALSLRRIFGPFQQD